MAGDQGSVTAGRYASWEGAYRALDRAPDLSPRRQLAVHLMGLVLVLAAVTWTVHEVRAHGWSGFPVVWVWGLLWLLWTALSARWPAGTRVGPTGLTVRAHLLRVRTVAWDEVVEVQPPGRFDEHPVALLAGGERLEMLGLPADVAEAMAEVTRPEPVRPTSAPPRRPEPGEDLDGPFHRGPARR